MTKCLLIGGIQSIKWTSKITLTGDFQLDWEITRDYENGDGEVEKINMDNICFKRIYVCGMYRDGECFDGKEDHV